MVDVQVKVVWGNIAQLPADVLLTTTHPIGKQKGEVDRAIERIAGEFFHRQLAINTPLRSNQLIYVPAHRSKKLIPFGGVIYVVDDLMVPLNAHVVAGLARANTLRLANVNIPLLRLDTYAAVHDGGMRQQAVFELVKGVKTFCKEKPRFVEKITVVAYGRQGNDMSYAQDLLKLD